MKNRLNTAVRVLAAAAAMAVATGAAAQSAGTWTAKVGINKITPHVDSGDISAPALPGTKADVKADTKPILTFAYMVTDNISAELDLGVPYKHELVGDGAIKGTGKLGTAEALPPTAFIQYRFFQANAMIRPYVGAGLTYAYFQKETGSGQMTALLDPGGSPVTYRLKNKIAASLQIGSTLAFNERWFADVAVVKNFLKTKATFSTGQTQDIKLDPIAVSIGIGYKF
ncbi:OmpW/AlkL family protein [Janthinobacterium sp. HLX7-2]|uniref:OmpW/AlkL family protein n=1 Tax=Janthinobacterium sp. HLX7-2 TaxID=1259331 RepID=UPI003F21BBE4